MSRYTILTSMVKSNGHNNIVAQALDKAIEQLAKVIASTKTRPVGSTVGLLELDDRPSDRRLRPAQSPERRGKRKSKDWL
jgi:hypothetical protein